MVHTLAVLSAGEKKLLGEYLKPGMRNPNDAVVDAVSMLKWSAEQCQSEEDCVS